MATVTLATSIQPRVPQGSFRNEPFTDFKNPENARAMRAALELVAGQLGHEYDLVIGGLLMAAILADRALRRPEP